MAFAVVRAFPLEVESLPRLQVVRACQALGRGTARSRIMVSPGRCSVVISGVVKYRKISFVPRILGKHVWLLGPRASHQVTLPLLGKMEKSINSAGIRGTDSIILFFFGHGPPSSGHRLPLSPRRRTCRGQADGYRPVGAVRSRATCVRYLF